MPRAPSTCSEPGCYELVGRSGPCPKHAPRAWAGSTHPGSTRDWKRRRVRIFERDGYTCQIRGPDCTVAATEVDHVLALALGGTDDDENLRSACRPCHKQKTAEDSHRSPRRRRQGVGGNH